MASGDASSNGNTSVDHTPPASPSMVRKFSSGALNLFRGKSQGSAEKKQKPVKAKLGEKNQFYFDEDLKMWREKGGSAADTDAAAEAAAVAAGPPLSFSRSNSISEATAAEAAAGGVPMGAPPTGGAVGQVPMFAPPSAAGGIPAPLRARYVDSFKAYNPGDAAGGAAGAGGDAGKPPRPGSGGPPVARLFVPQPTLAGAVGEGDALPAMFIPGAAPAAEGGSEDRDGPADVLASTTALAGGEADTPMPAEGGAGDAAGLLGEGEGEGGGGREAAEDDHVVSPNFARAPVPFADTGDVTDDEQIFEAIEEAYDATGGTGSVVLQPSPRGSMARGAEGGYTYPSAEAYSHPSSPAPSPGSYRSYEGSPSQFPMVHPVSTSTEGGAGGAVGSGAPSPDVHRRASRDGFQDGGGEGEAAGGFLGGGGGGGGYDPAASSAADGHTVGSVAQEAAEGGHGAGVEGAPEPRASTSSSHAGEGGEALAGPEPQAEAAAEQGWWTQDGLKYVMYDNSGWWSREGVWAAFDGSGYWSPEGDWVGCTYGEDGGVVYTLKDGSQWDANGVCLVTATAPPEGWEGHAPGPEAAVEAVEAAGAGAEAEAAPRDEEGEMVDEEGEMVDYSTEEPCPARALSAGLEDTAHSGTAGYGEPVGGGGEQGAEEELVTAPPAQVDGAEAAGTSGDHLDRAEDEMAAYGGGQGDEMAAYGGGQEDEMAAYGGGQEAAEPPTSNGFAEHVEPPPFYAAAGAAAATAAAAVGAGEPPAISSQAPAAVGAGEPPAISSQAPAAVGAGEPPAISSQAPASPPPASPSLSAASPGQLSPGNAAMGFAALIQGLESDMSLGDAMAGYGEGGGGGGGGGYEVDMSVASVDPLYDVAPELASYYADPDSPGAEAPPGSASPLLSPAKEGGYPAAYPSPYKAEPVSYGAGTDAPPVAAHEAESSEAWDEGGVAVAPPPAGWEVSRDDDALAELLAADASAPAPAAPDAAAGGGEGAEGGAGGAGEESVSVDLDTTAEESDVTGSDLHTSTSLEPRAAGAGGAGGAGDLDTTAYSAHESILGQPTDMEVAKFARELQYHLGAATGEAAGGSGVGDLFENQDSTMIAEELMEAAAGVEDMRVRAEDLEDELEDALARANSAEDEAARLQGEVARLTAALAAATTSPAAAPGPAVGEDTGALLREARDAGREEGLKAGQDDMADLLIALGQEEAKVGRLSEMIQGYDAGVNIDALLASIEDEIGFGDFEDMSVDALDGGSFRTEVHPSSVAGMSQLVDTSACYNPTPADVSAADSSVVSEAAGAEEAEEEAEQQGEQEASPVASPSAGPPGLSPPPGMGNAGTAPGLSAVAGGWRSPGGGAKPAGGGGGSSSKKKKSGGKKKGGVKK